MAEVSWNPRFLKQKEFKRSHRRPGQEIAIHSEGPNGAAKDNITTARIGPISSKHEHINPLNPASKCEPIPPKICPVPSRLRPDPLVGNVEGGSASMGRRAEGTLRGTGENVFDIGWTSPAKGIYCMVFWSIRKAAKTVLESKSSRFPEEQFAQVCGTPGR
ncbi:hypothetical protein B0H17DRAFT_1150690 [Mycena rosella]|uniref:Uncharacterized protein n=1 Tax=Mycena rosella TaxID=1033263 RepID=A0AAD7BQR4_MYCRO|nr:hypothetical protein B0H17DRAFT_1150690 [Mycena rosella]